MSKEYGTGNYREQGGDTLVIGGKLVIKGTLVVEDGATVEGVGGGSAAHVEVQTASTATTVAGLKEDFNALLAKLKAAGIMLDTSKE